MHWRFSAVATVLFALFVRPVPAAAQTPTVPQPDLTPLVETTVAPAGSTVRLALRVALPEGFHLQSNRPRDPSVIPTVLWIDTHEHLGATEVVFPETTEFAIPGYDEPLLVFEHEFLIGVQVSVDPAAPEGEITLPGLFRYQACDDRVCFNPTTAAVSWTLRIGAAGDATPRDHAEVFDAIAFGSGTPPPTDRPPPPSPTRRAPPEADTDPGLARLDRFTILSSPLSNGYMGAEDFLEFIRNAEAGTNPPGLFEGRSVVAILAITAIGGLLLNLTPCVLPMIPINIAIIGAGAQAGKRRRGFLLGATYGGAMAVVYGLLGLIVILTAGTFGTINASPWFNVGIAAIFVVLGLAMFDVFTVDFSSLSSRIRFDEASRGTFVLAFGMGAVAALLAGACVAPVVIQVILFASDLYARGAGVALALPFFLGLGMALPWPIAGAGIAALPRPGAWMVRVKQAFGVFILATAAYYAWVGYGLFANRWVDPGEVAASVQSQLDAGWYADLNEGLTVAERDQTLVLVDMWATWCKNCLTMDRTTLADPDVRAALEGYAKIKVQAEDLSAYPVSELMKRFGAVGLPAYVILRPTSMPLPAR